MFLCGFRSSRLFRNKFFIWDYLGKFYIRHHRNKSSLNFWMDQQNNNNLVCRFCVLNVYWYHAQLAKKYSTFPFVPYCYEKFWLVDLSPLVINLSNWHYLITLKICLATTPLLLRNNDDISDVAVNFNFLSMWINLQAYILEQMQSHCIQWDCMHKNPVFNVQKHFVRYQEGKRSSPTSSAHKSSR